MRQDLAHFEEIKVGQVHCPAQTGQEEWSGRPGLKQ